MFQEVNLGNNEVALDGGLAIVEALKGKPDLESLELDGMLLEASNALHVWTCFNLHIC